MRPLWGEALMEEIFLRTISLAGYLITKLLLICPNSSKSSRVIEDAIPAVMLMMGVSLMQDGEHQRLGRKLTL